MSDFLAFLSLICLIALVVGLVKPSLVVRWGEKRTRLRAFMIYGGLLIVFAVLGSAMTSPEEKAAIAEKARIEQQQKAELEAKNAAEKKAKAEQDAKAAAEKQKREKDDYIKSAQHISFQALSRNPDNYKGKIVTFSGKVVQVQESGNDVVMRINVTQKQYGWDDTVWVNYTKVSKEGRILENDIITFWGQYKGIREYKAVMGNTISVPEITAKYVLQAGPGRD